MLVRASRKLYALLWGAALVLLVVLALYASLGRQYIGLVDRYQQDIFHYIEGLTGVSMQASSVRGSWSGLSPVIEISDFNLGSEAAVHLDNARIEIDVLASILTGTPKVRQIQAGSLRIELEQTSEGQWQIPGIVTTDTRGGSPDMLIDLVLGVRRAALDLFVVKLGYSNGDVKHISSRDFSLRSDDKFRRIYAQLNTDSDGDIQMLLEAYGDPRNLEKFSGNAYMVIDGSRLSAIAPIFQQSAPLFDSEVSGELWMSWRRGQRVSMSGVLNAPELAVGVLWGADDALLRDVNMRFAGSHRDGFWRISFTEFDAKWRDRGIDLSGISVRHPEDTLWRFTLPQLEVGATNALLTESDILPEYSQGVLSDLAPEGLLKHIQFDLYTSGSRVESFALRAEAADLSVKPWQGAPGAQGLTGYLEIGPQQGLLMVDSQALSLSFPHLYDDAFKLEDVKAELRWDYDDQRLRLHSGLIKAINNDKRLSALLRLDLPLHKEVEPGPTMTLMVGAKGIDASQYNTYTPNILSDSLQEWLASSIQGGTVNTAGFIFHGSLLAKSEYSPSIQLALDLSDVELRFLQDWPAIKAQQAQLVIDNAEITAASRSATLNDMALNPLSVHVTPSAEGYSVLDVAAAATPNFKQIKSLLLDTPLHSYIGNTFDSWTGEGNANVDVGIHLPLANGYEPNIRVDSDIDFSVLGLPDYRLTLSAAKGHLHYETEEGLSSSNLNATVFEKPLTAMISQVGKQIDVDVATTVTASDIGQWLNTPVLQFFKGSTGIKMRVQAGGEKSGLTISSDLKGVEIALPQPFYKSPSLSQQLAIWLPFDGDGILGLALEDQLNLQLGLNDSGVYGANLYLGSSEENTAMLRPLIGQFNVAGSIEFASFSQWQNIADQYLSSLQPSGGASMVLAVNGLDIDEVYIFDHLLENVRLAVSENYDFWQVRVASQQLSGELAFPRNSSSTVATVILEKLALPSFDDQSTSSSADLDPMRLMDVNVDIDQLSVGGEAWGRVGFDLRIDERGAHFNALRGQLRGIDLAREAGASSLHWLKDEAGNQTSWLQGLFGVGDLGPVLEGFGYSKVMETKRGNYNVDIHWPGAPTQWKLLQSEGEFSFSFENGRFLKSSDAASGALRVFSIFNMANIVRRLKFDFRDVFSKGIYFDSMRGSLSLSEGIVELKEPLDIKGPSSGFQMTGTIDLNTDIPDLRLVATLPVGSNLPWVAALVGGLPAAAGAYVVTKVFEEQVNSFSSAVYDISGTVQQPELTFKNIFDVGSGDVSKAKEKTKDKSSEVPK
ncbi:Uncharacterised protein [Zhongshania aliphaticivorans]|uniref:YhdP central domain-containing protein n=1 Tax=Zhongshania aliphaticivorans TaxID=1470434 RepID=A0A5S9N102_9GAMM|nr:YhdP family protein [Zhongshania aliphaticivorans]CAA0083303.1 Uncharacterised protein [Zhongshania aliphaticivorans]CAA0083470.1 Uncharacterised protein [Zhongshania aliphaticivorans]